MKQVTEDAGTLIDVGDGDTLGFGKFEIVDWSDELINKLFIEEGWGMVRQGKVGSGPVWQGEVRWGMVWFYLRF